MSLRHPHYSPRGTSRPDPEPEPEASPRYRYRLRDALATLARFADGSETLTVEALLPLLKTRARLRSHNRPTPEQVAAIDALNAFYEGLRKSRDPIWVAAERAWHQELK